jgi:hypothetical protein
MKRGGNKRVVGTSALPRRKGKRTLAIVVAALARGAFHQLKSLADTKIDVGELTISAVKKWVNANRLVDGAPHTISGVVSAFCDAGVCEMFREIGLDGKVHSRCKIELYRGG